MNDGPPLADAISPLSFLLGTWSGRGHGSYPTIESFDYLETIELSHVGKPFLAYRQRTRRADDGRPLHAETGYWRLHGSVNGPTGVELVIAHPFGITEVLEGSLERPDPVESGGEPASGPVVIDLVSTVLGATSTAKSVVTTTRRFTIVGDELTYDMAMAAVGVPLTHHLHAVLRREG